MRGFTGRGLREAGSNLFAATLFAGFASAQLASFAATHRPSVLLVFAVETFAAVLFVARARAERTSASLWDWFTTLGGTFAPLLLRPVERGGDVVAGQGLQVAGALLALWGLASLSRSFGLLPAVRGLRVGGAYRLVRHPLYLAYTLQSLGYVLNHPTRWNSVVVAAAFAFQLLRVRNEERVLATVPGHEAYRRRTPWRIVPLVY